MNHFDEKKVVAVGASLEGAQASNLSLEKLARTRLARMVITPMLRQSQLAWKLAMLRQGLTWRLVDLAEGAIREWNEDRYLSAMILARAFLETAALVHSVSMRVRVALDGGDTVALHDIADTESLGSRLQKWIDQDGYKSTNVLKALDQMEKSIAGVRGFYEQISEAAHPNGRGTVQFYARIDTSTAEVNFSPTMHAPAHMFDMVQASLIMLDWSRLRLAELDQMVEQASRVEATSKGKSGN